MNGARSRIWYTRNMEVKLGKYQHYKGGMYKVLGVGKHSETLEDLVVYESLHENETSKLWVRPAEMFFEEVEINGKKMPRFKYVG